MTHDANLFDEATAVDLLAQFRFSNQRIHEFGSAVDALPGITPFMARAMRDVGNRYNEPGLEDSALEVAPNWSSQEARERTELLSQCADLRTYLERTVRLSDSDKTSLEEQLEKLNDSQELGQWFKFSSQQTTSAAMTAAGATQAGTQTQSSSGFLAPPSNQEGLARHSSSLDRRSSSRSPAPRHLPDFVLEKGIGAGSKTGSTKDAPSGLQIPSTSGGKRILLFSSDSDDPADDDTSESEVMSPARQKAHARKVAQHKAANVKGKVKAAASTVGTATKSKESDKAKPPSHAERAEAEAVINAGRKGGDGGPGKHGRASKQVEVVIPPRHTRERLDGAAALSAPGPSRPVPKQALTVQDSLMRRWQSSASRAFLVPDSEDEMSDSDNVQHGEGRTGNDHAQQASDQQPNTGAVQASRDQQRKKPAAKRRKVAEDEHLSQEWEGDIRLSKAAVASKGGFSLTAGYEGFRYLSSFRKNGKVKERWTCLKCNEPKMCSKQGHNTNLANHLQYCKGPKPSSIRKPMTPSLTAAATAGSPSAPASSTYNGPSISGWLVGQQAFNVDLTRRLSLVNIIVNYLPFAYPKSWTNKQALKSVDYRSTQALVSRFTVLRDLYRLHNDMHAALMHELHNHDSLVALQHDAWTNKGFRHSFVAIVGSFVNAKWE
ncbi:hypothetical protein V8E36_007820 [Tilletia maclaganii]